MKDKNLKKVFKIRRINYSVIAVIESIENNMYIAKILDINGQTLNKPGDILPISKRELELTGKPVSFFKF